MATLLQDYLQQEKWHKFSQPAVKYSTRKAQQRQRLQSSSNSSRKSSTGTTLECSGNTISNSSSTIADSSSNTPPSTSNSVASTGGANFGRWCLRSSSEISVKEEQQQALPKKKQRPALLPSNAAAEVYIEEEEEELGVAVEPLVYREGDSPSKNCDRNAQEKPFLVSRDSGSSSPSLHFSSLVSLSPFPLSDASLLSPVAADTPQQTQLRRGRRRSTQETDTERGAKPSPVEEEEEEQQQQSSSTCNGWGKRRHSSDVGSNSSCRTSVMSGRSSSTENSAGVVKERKHPSSCRSASKTKEHQEEQAQPCAPRCYPFSSAPSSSSVCSSCSTQFGGSSSSPPFSSCCSSAASSSRFPSHASSALSPPASLSSIFVPTADSASLPVLQYAAAIVEAVKKHPVTLIVGETGSGKTTQIPQLLYATGFAAAGVIGITQPRRVAAVSLAARVAHELSHRLQKQQQHQHHQQPQRQRQELQPQQEKQQQLQRRPRQQPLQAQEEQRERFRHEEPMRLSLRQKQKKQQVADSVQQEQQQEEKQEEVALRGGGHASSFGVCHREAQQLNKRQRTARSEASPPAAAAARATAAAGKEEADEGGKFLAHGEGSWFPACTGAAEETQEECSGVLMRRTLFCSCCGAASCSRVRTKRSLSWTDSTEKKEDTGGRAKRAADTAAAAAATLSSSLSFSFSSSLPPPFLLPSSSSFLPSPASSPFRFSPSPLVQREKSGEESSVRGGVLGDVVGYSVRFEDMTSRNTRIKFLTDGLLLREAMVDPLLSRYSVIIIDEAHERSLRSDVLLGYLKRQLLLQQQEAEKRKRKKMEEKHEENETKQQKQENTEEKETSKEDKDGEVEMKKEEKAQLRGCMRLVVMSATLERKKFLSFFPNAKLLAIPGRSYPLDVFHAAAPQDDYVEAALIAAMQIHLSAADGDILIFLPGQEDIEGVHALLLERRHLLRAAAAAATTNRRTAALSASPVHQTRRRDSSKNIRMPSSSPVLAAHPDCSVPSVALASAPSCFSSSATLLPTSSAAAAITAAATTTAAAATAAPFAAAATPAAATSAAAAFFTAGAPAPSTGAASAIAAAVESSPRISVRIGEEIFTQRLPFQDFVVCPLYAALPFEKQKAVFAPAPPGSRKIVLATNIAETSLTLQGIRFVVDTGLAKCKVVNHRSGIEALVVREISKESATQRAGRAARESPGAVYRLYTEETYEKFETHREPEIVSSDLGQVYLELKALRIGNPLEFPFLDPPPAEAFFNAGRMLHRLGALDAKGDLTALGWQLSALPLSPLLGKLLLESLRLGCTAEVLTVVAMLSTDTLWNNGRTLSGSKVPRLSSCRQQLIVDQSDHLTLLNVYNKWEEAPDKVVFCREYGLHFNAMRRAVQIRQQLEQLVKSSSIGANEIKTGGSDDNWALVRQCLAAGCWLNTARLQRNGTSYVTAVQRMVARLHPSSVLFGKTPLPGYIVYSEYVQTTKPYLRCVTAIEGNWLHQLVPRWFSAVENAV